MALLPPQAYTGCDYLAPGVDYLVTTSSALTVAIGRNTSAMTLVSIAPGERLFLRGPGYIKQLGASTLQALELLFSTHGPLSSGGGGGGHEPPILGE